MKIIKYILTNQNQHNKLLKKGSLMLKKMYIPIIIITLGALNKNIIAQNHYLPIPIAQKNDLIKKSISYVGFIKYPSSFKNTPLEKCSLPRIYYKGSVMNLSLNYDDDMSPLCSYTCFYESALSTFDIVIALVETPKKNTIETLKVPAGSSYLHYQLKAEKTLLKNEYCWNIKETRGVGPFTIPSSAVVIIEDADLIKGVKKESNWNTNGLSILLPTIIYVDVDKELFEYIHNIALLASLDIDGFHKKEEWVILQSPKNQIFKTRIS